MEIQIRKPGALLSTSTLDVPIDDEFIKEMNRLAFNLKEDVRIERRLADEYAGMDTFSVVNIDRAERIANFIADLADKLERMTK